MIASQLLPDNAIEIYQGSSMSLLLTVKRPSDDNPNTLVWFDLTGATIYFTVKKYVGDSEALIHKNSLTAAYAEITDARGGLAKVYLSPGDTATLNAGDYEYDAWVVLSSGKRYPVIHKSIFRVLPSVTRLAR